MPLGMEGRDDTKLGINPNPFNNAESDETSATWARNVTRAESANEDDPPARVSELAKERLPEDENPTGLGVVRSAAHAARQKLHLDSIKATGPSKLFNPTNVRVHVKWRDDVEDSSISTVNEGALLWRSRDNRKGRNSIAVPATTGAPPSTPLRARLPPHLRQIAKNTLQMFTTFPYWDMAFWSGWAYTWGSVLFVIDGVWAWKDVAIPGSQIAGLTTYGSPLCFFFGALLYELGAVMAYFEAVNDGSFQGSAMRRFLEGHEEDSKKMLDDKIHSFFGHFIPHHHRHSQSEEVDPEAGWKAKDRHQRPGSIYPSEKAPPPRRGGIDLGEAEEGTSSVYMTWRWWPTWHALKTHHVYEIGYLACAIQLFGATLYGIIGVVDLPGILASLAPWQEEGAFWGPDIVASVCFLTAAFLFTFETQEKWYQPELTSIGWWIGLWAMIGSMGFLLSGVFGAASFNVGFGEYQSDLSSLWGSAAYLISGLLQWYEATNKRPFAELLDERGPMKSFQVHPI